jgi:hypothetical protein
VSRIKAGVAVAAFGWGMGLAAQPAGADLAARNNGVGVCTSQIAIASEEILGASNLGEVVASLAASRSVPASLDGMRNTCGEPPGPVHLGR